MYLMTLYGSQMSIIIQICNCNLQFLLLVYLKINTGNFQKTPLDIIIGYYHKHAK